MKIRRLEVVAWVLIGTATTLLAADGTWIAPGGGAWSDTSKWQNQTVAEGSGATATFDAAGSGTVNNDMTALALRGVLLGGAGYTLAGNTLALDAAGFITVLGGSHTVGLPLTLGGDTTVTAASGAALALDGDIDGAGGLTLSVGNVALGGANTFSGPFNHVRGIISFADPAALGASTAPAILGEGAYRYTGPSATFARGLTLRAGVQAATNRAAVIDITDPDTTLTVSGRVRTEGGAFVKTGPGTVAFTYPGAQTIGLNSYGTANGVLAFDEDGILTNGNNRFTIERGTMRLGAPGQTNVIQAGWVGCRSLYSPTLEINGGYHRFVNDYFTIARGTGTIASPQSPGMIVDGGATVVMEGSGFVMDNAHGQSNHRGRPWLRVDGGSTFKVNGHVFLGENDRATGTVDIVNGSTFISDNQTHNRGMIVSPATGADMTITFDSVSTNQAYLMRVGRGGKVTYKGGSVLELDGSPTTATAGGNTEGSVTFDNATLRQRTPSRSSDWFPGSHDLSVGPGGLTVDVSKYAWIGPALKAAGTGGAITKTGPGMLAISSPQVPVTVAEGTLALVADAVNVAPASSASVTALPGAAVEVSGANALAVTPVTTDALLLKAPSLTAYPDEWVFQKAAQAGRNDGHLRLTPDHSAGNGYAWLARKRAVTGPWTARFTYRVFAQMTQPADGVALIIQNDARGTSVSEGGAQNVGYQADTGVPGITNSVAIGLLGYAGYRWLTLGQAGLWTVTNTVLPVLDNSGAPWHVTVRYDGAGTLGVEVERPDRLFRHAQTYAVNLADEVGADEAYVGFAAGTGGSWGAHTITDFTFESDVDSPRSAAIPYRLGGAFTLGADETLAVSLRLSTMHSAFALGSLTYSAGAALDISTTAADAIPVPVPLPAITLADQPLWSLSGSARWLPDGTLAHTIAASGQPGGGSLTTNRYPVAGSWTAQIGYAFGEASPWPADYIQFRFVNGSRNFAVQWRYYDGNIRSTRLKIVKNNDTQVITDDIAPVTLTNRIPATFIVNYDSPAKVLTVTSVQDGVGTNVTAISDIDIAAVLGTTEAQIGFDGATGGQWTENIITDFSFTPLSLPDLAPTPSSSAPASLAFDSYSGTGPLTVRGGTLNLPGNIDRPTANLAIKLEDGAGLLLGKTSLAPLDSTLNPRSDWLFSAIGSWASGGAMQFCAAVNSTNGTVTSTRRVRVSDAWTCSFDYTWGKGMNSPADAFCMFLHNDPRGPGYSRGNTTGAGFEGMQNSVGVRWYFYPYNTTGYKNRVTIGYGGVFPVASMQLHEPVIFYSNAVTRVTVQYDPIAKTLTSIIGNDGPRSDTLNPSREFRAVTNVFTDVDIAQRVGGDYAYVGFGGGTGGVNAEMRACGVHFASDTPYDAMSDVDSLASLELPAGATGHVTLDSPVPDATFNIPALTLGDGATFALAACDTSIPTLALSAVTLNGDGTLDVAATARCEAGTVTGTGSLAKRGAGTLALADIAAYTGDTQLEAGTLALDAARLPRTDLHVTSGATLNLAFTGKQYVHALFVNGAPMPGGCYTAANAAWITGPGTLIVTYPPSGSILFLR